MTFCQLVRGKSGQSTSHQQNDQIFHNICVLPCLTDQTLLHFLSSGLVFFRLLVHLDNVASQFGLGLFGLTNGKLPHQDHIDKDAKGPPRKKPAWGWGTTTQPAWLRGCKVNYIRPFRSFREDSPIEIIIYIHLQ